MSSHHIVRDKQEPALVILDLENFDKEHLGQLLEWSPTVLVAQNVYEKVVSMGIKIDVLICNQEKKIQLQEAIKYIEINFDRDVLPASLNFFISQHYPAVNIICKNFNLTTIKQYISKIDLVIFSNNKKCYPIKTGFSKWSAGNSLIEVLGRSFGYQGLKKLTENKFITVKDGFFSFSFDDDYIFLVENL